MVRGANAADQIHPSPIATNVNPTAFTTVSMAPRVMAKLEWL
jgi:hypothetical protein